MKKVIAFFLIITMIFSFAYTEDTGSDVIEPINKEAVPDWVKYLRRFEIVTLGSLPFTVIGASSIYTVVRWGINGFDTSSLPNPFAFTSTQAGLNTDEQMIVLFSALGASVLLGAIDLTIFAVKKEKAKKANAKLLLPENIQLNNKDIEDENSENEEKNTESTTEIINNDDDVKIESQF